MRVKVFFYLQKIKRVKMKIISKLRKFISGISKNPDTQKVIKIIPDRTYKGENNPAYVPVKAEKK